MTYRSIKKGDLVMVKIIGSMERSGQIGLVIEADLTHTIDNGRTGGINDKYCNVFWPDNSVTKFWEGYLELVSAK